MNCETFESEGRQVAKVEISCAGLRTIQKCAVKVVGGGEGNCENEKLSRKKTDFPKQNKNDHIHHGS